MDDDGLNYAGPVAQLLEEPKIASASGSDLEEDAELKVSLPNKSQHNTPQHNTIQ
jgi:hypothetical protein